MKLSVLGKLLVLAAAGIVAWWGPDVPQVATRLGGPSFPDALLALGTLVAVAIAAWTLVVTALVVAGASWRLIGLVTPRMLRHALLVGAAGALVIAPAHAEQAGSPDAVVRHSVSGLPFPDRPDALSSSPVAPRPAAPSAPTAAESVTVLPGDTLWAIARRGLPDGATTTQIAAAARAWHDANRDVIGDDPDLIFPAQRLIPPTAKDLP